MVGCKRVLAVPLSADVGLSRQSAKEQHRVKVHLCKQRDVNGHQQAWVIPAAERKFDHGERRSEIRVWTHEGVHVFREAKLGLRLFHSLPQACL